MYFLPVTETAISLPQLEKMKIKGPNEPEIIPEDIMQRLRPKRIVNLAQLKKGLTSEQDGIIAGRTGFVEQTKDGDFVFLFDALGRNIDDTSFSLLKCQALERIVTRQSESPEPLRYKIAGILTKYNGKYYLLLQRATRTYTHGNFGR